MGPIPQHKARADFVTSFMQVAAFEVVTNNGFPTVEEVVKAALSPVQMQPSSVRPTLLIMNWLQLLDGKGIKAKSEMKVFLKRCSKCRTERDL